MLKSGVSLAGLSLIVILVVILAPHSIIADSARHSPSTSVAARSAPLSVEQAARSVHAAPPAKGSSNGSHSSDKVSTVKSTKTPASHGSKDKSGDKKGSGGATKKDTSKKPPATGRDVHKSGSGSKQNKGQPSKKTNNNDGKGHGAKSDNTKTTNNKGTDTKVTGSKDTRTKATDKGTNTKVTNNKDTKVTDKGTKAKATDNKGSQMTKGPVQQRPQQQQQQQPSGNPHGLVDKDHVKTILPLPPVADQTSDTVENFLRASQRKAGQGIPAVGEGIGGVKTGQGVTAAGGGIGGVKTPVKVKMTDSNQVGKNYFQNSDDVETGSGSISNPDSPFPAYMNFPTCTDRTGGGRRGGGRGGKEGKGRGAEGRGVMAGCCL